MWIVSSTPDSVRQSQHQDMEPDCGPLLRNDIPESWRGEDWKRLYIESRRKAEVAEEAGITEEESGEWQERSWRK